MPTAAPTDTEILTSWRLLSGVAQPLADKPSATTIAASETAIE